MDFTLKTYRQLLQALQNQGFVFQTFAEFLERPTQPLSPEGVGLPLGNKRASEGKQKQKTIILRHDVDLLPQNSLRFAQIQHELGIKGTYFFRIVPQSFHSQIIGQIANLGHEIGYHYEDVDLAYKFLKKSPSQPLTPEGERPPFRACPDSSGELKGSEEKVLINTAIQLFEKHIKELRKLYPVKTICMHGSPRSKFDNKLLWEYYNYRDYGIIGEPYFDVNFDKIFYLTDTGRRWDGWKVSVRDKVPQQEQWKEQGLVFGTTQDIIRRVESGDEETRRQGDEETKGQGDEETRGLGEKTGRFPDKVMITFHPQRWHSSFYLWLRELILQNAKNQIKRFLVK